MNNIVLLSLGSNIGNRKKNISKTLKKLKKYLSIIKTSSIYKTTPIGYKKQRDFYNNIVLCKTSLSPFLLLKKIKETEIDLGRKKTFRWGPRIIDIDIIIYADRLILSKKLTIPHKEMFHRRFVLEPILEIMGCFPKYINKNFLYILNNVLEQICEKT